LRRFWALAVAALACGGGGDGSIVVAAASDLAAAMPALVEAFERESSVRVDATLGSSGQIANQVLHGAPVDVFASADRGWIDRLAGEGRLDNGSDPVVYAYGRLVLVVPPGRVPPASVDELRDVAWRRIAIANPEHAPYGVAAREALEHAGLWDLLQERLVIGENVRQTYQYARAGSVDVAIAAWSLVESESDRWTLVPETHNRLEQTVAAIGGRPNAEAARAFVRFMASPAARDILRRYNFVVPEP
jgi:molybdate transport system substrate-binding protein